MYKELKSCEQHTKQYRKSIALVAAMRLKHHQPSESLEILSIHNDIDVNIRYVRILSYTYLNQFDHVLRLLEMTVASTANHQSIPKIPDQLVRKGKAINFETDKKYSFFNCLLCLIFNSYKKSRKSWKGTATKNWLKSIHWYTMNWSDWIEFSSKYLHPRREENQIKYHFTDTYRSYHSLLTSFSPTPPLSL